MILFILAAVQVVQTEQRINYPETRREHVVDQYHGVEVQDPYRFVATRAGIGEHTGREGGKLSIRAYGVAANAAYQRATSTIQQVSP